MDVRVTPQIITQHALSDSQYLSSQLASLQSQASSGKRFSAVSDDPAASLGILSSSAQDQTLGAHLQNIQTSLSTLNASTSALQQVSSIFSEAKSIAVEASNSSNDTSSFEALAQQVDSLIGQLLDAANTQQNGTYVFAGSANQTQPFTVTSTNAQGNPQVVQYHGSDAVTSALVNSNEQVALDYPGSDVFTATNRQAAVFTGNTGATAGAGTDTATGQTSLIFRHTLTTFAPGSGVQAGNDSAAQDTILGPAGQHHLHITDTSGNGAAGTVSLDGGPAIAFTSNDANLRVTNAAGDAVYLNTTAIAANFDGDVSITANGSMSSDGGASSTPITFDPTQYATDSSNGQVVFVDTSAVTRTGTETVDHPGTSSAFQALIDLRDELRNVNNSTQHDQITAISNQIGELDQVHNKVLATLGKQSASLQTLNSLQTHLQDMQTAAKANVSALGDASITDIVVKMQAYQQMLQLSLETFAQISSVNLLDYLK